MSEARRIRCFVALDLPEDFRAEALRVQTCLRKLSLFEGRFTKENNLHLTLKFLGEISQEKLTSVTEALGRLSEPVFKVQLEHAGMFAARIVWLKIGGADVLQARIDEALTEWFAPESRFMGHITIARIKSAKKRKALADKIRAMDVRSVSGLAQSFSFYQSTLSHEGPKYEVIKSYPLRC